MRGLTLWEPYATLVGSTIKTVETRSWGTPYRGPVAIHAARKFDDEVEALIRQAVEDCKKVWGKAFLRPECLDLVALPWSKKLGCVVAVARLVDCRPMSEAPNRQEELFGHYGPGRWGWQFDPASITPLANPVPCRGMQGLWTVPADLVAELQAILPPAR